MLQWLPDAPETTPDVLVEVSAIPTTRGYRNPYTPITSGLSALAANAQGGALVLKLDGTYRTLAGTATRIYEAAGGTWTDISRGGLYSIGSQRWRFGQFGNTTLACNKSTQLQQSSSGAFADIASAPKAACIETVAGFVMLGNVDDTGTGLPTAFGDSPDRWWCSQIFTPTGSWDTTAGTASQAAQATSGRLVATPGAITGFKRLGNDIVAYKAKSMYLGRYTGPGEVWNFQLIANDRGAATQEAVVDAGSAHFFIGDSDIFRFDGSAKPEPIGAGVKEWFFRRLNRSYAFAIESMHDAVNSTVYWFYPSGSNTTPDSCLVYNYVSRLWGHFTLAIRSALQAVTSAITYDTLGTVFPGDYDALPAIGYDSPFWLASTPVLSIIGTDNILYSLTGTTGPSSFTTGWIGDESITTSCDRVRPKFRTKPTTAQMTPATLAQLGDTAITGLTTSINGAWWDLIQAGNYHRFACAFTGAMEIEAVLPRLHELNE